jgi:hypothetical protein
MARASTPILRCKVVSPTKFNAPSCEKVVARLLCAFDPRIADGRDRECQTDRIVAVCQRFSSIIHNACDRIAHIVL